MKFRRACVDCFFYLQVTDFQRKQFTFIYLISKIVVLKISISKTILINVNRNRIICYLGKNMSKQVFIKTQDVCGVYKELY